MVKRPATASSTLLRWFSERDSEACALLCLIDYPVVYRWARQAGCEHAFAEDVLHEVFLKPAPNLKGRYRSWLKSVFRSRMIDLIRRDINHPDAVGGRRIETSPAPTAALYNRVLQLDVSLCCLLFMSAVNSL